MFYFTLHKPDLSSENSLGAHTLVDILWNCFAILKHYFSSDYLTGFLNYYFAQYCLLKYVELKPETDDTIRLRITQIKKTLDLYVEALILNGFLNSRYLSGLLRTNLSWRLDQLSSTTAYELEYMEEALDRLKQSVGNYSSVLRLSDLCRIRVKCSMKHFCTRSVHALNVSDGVKEFLLFDRDLSRFYNEVEHF